MRKIIDALAILSFLGTATVIGGGVYVYTQKDAIIDGVKKQVVDAAVNGVSDALPECVLSARLLMTYIKCPKRQISIHCFTVFLGASAPKN